jgi:hypothetical protein
MSDLKQSPAAFLQGRNGDQTKEPLEPGNPSRKPTGRSSSPGVNDRRSGVG